MRLLLVVLVAALALATAASAATFRPAPRQGLHGAQRLHVGQPVHRAGGQPRGRVRVFTKWYGQNEYAFRAAREAGARLMLHVSTQDGYWPGGRYVDWVGTDFYSRFPNFDKLERFYDAFRGKPFVFGEWALWGRDDPGFVRRFFSWMGSHRRMRMHLYNQGALTNGPFRLNRYPRSRAVIRTLQRP
jgi:hypothetical protein